MAPEARAPPVGAEPARALPQPLLAFGLAAVMRLLEEHDIPPVPVQQAEERPTLGCVAQAVDVKAEEAEGGLLGAAHGGKGRRLRPSCWVGVAANQAPGGLRSRSGYRGVRAPAARQRMAWATAATVRAGGPVGNGVAGVRAQAGGGGDALVPEGGGGGRGARG